MVRPPAGPAGFPVAFAAFAMALALAILLPGPSPVQAAPYDPTPVLEDYERLKRYVAETHANLEWLLEHRDLDLPALDRETLAALRRARSDREAREAIRRFIRAFRDPHFRSTRHEPQSGRSASAAVITARTPARKACRQMRFEEADPGFPFARLPGFERLRFGRKDPFHSGILELEDGRRLGLLRIAQFGEDRYPDTCRETWERFRSHVSGICDGACEMAFRLEVRNGLLGRLEERVEALDEAGIDALVVDITGNGGGTDWVHGAARILSPRPLVCPRASFIKHPHWAGILESKREAIEHELERPGLAPGARDYLRAADAALAALLEETREGCDRSALWEAGRSAPGCSLLVEGDYSTCGLLDRPPPGAEQGSGNPSFLFKPFQNRYREGVNRKPLFILMDGRTASASEQFASILQGNGAATLVGQRTFGAGCGYTNGGVPLLLENAGLKVMAPDCVRYRADGVNEIEGIRPDIEIPWTPEESARRRTEKLLEALNRLPRQGDTPAGSARETAGGMVP